MIPKVFGPTEQEIKDQELALATYNQTMEAFNLVSLGMNKGKDQLKTLALVSESIEDGRASASRLNEFNKATNKIFKN